MPIETYVVSVPGADGKRVLDSFYARPVGDGPFPGLIVIHEIFGLNDNIRKITEDFAAEGYAALAVDLFANRPRAYCMMQAFYGVLIKPHSNPMLDDLKKAFDVLAGLPGVDPNRIGAVGFCMGGGYALQLAVTDKGLKAASVFYGMSPKPLEYMASTCPIVGHFPEVDFTTKAARELDAFLTTREVAHDIKFYPDTQHSFFNQQRTVFEVEASKDAWSRMLAFFREHIA